MRSAASSFASKVSTVLTLLLLLPLLSLGALAQVPPTNSPSTPPVGHSQGAASQQASPEGSAAPQTPTQEPISPEPGGGDQGSMFVFKKQVEEVFLHATVVDEQRRLVSDLDRGMFEVLDGGVPQAITSFRREDVPVAMGIVIDNSGSMREKRDKVSQAVVNLIRASNPRDQIFVVNFGQEPYLDQDFTSDVNLLQTSLHQVSAKGSTALYDAIVASAVHLQSSPLEKRVLLVITDGQDNMSRETLQEASQRLQQANGPTIYAIGLLGSGLSGTGREALQRLADRTGGVVYFPDTIDQVDSITRTVAHDIRHQYLIAYKPKNQNEKPGYQSVKVQACAPGYGKLTVRTRTGYYPGDTAR
jgi:Ca-activated chloride channel family protein